MGAPSVPFPRLQARRLPVRAGRVPRPPARLLFIAAALIAVLLGGWLWLRDSPLVGVRQVTVTGADGPQAAQIRRAVEQARAEAEASLVGRVQNAAQAGSWRAACWLPERRWPERRSGVGP